MTEIKTHWKDVAIEGMTEWERNFYEGKDALVGYVKAIYILG